MVLVFDKPNGYIGLLQTKLSHRERHEARRIGEEAMPLDEYIEDGHGEGEAGVEILPAPMHHLLEVAEHGEHGEHRLHQHAILPLPARTEFEVGRVALGGVETGIAQDNHAS